MNGGGDIKENIYYIVVGTLALVMISVIAVLLIGLFDARVDNGKIFEILGPAFQTIVGCFVGILGGRALRSSPPAPDAAPRSGPELPQIETQKLSPG